MLTSRGSTAIRGRGANGLGVSRDGTLLFVADSITNEVQVFNLAQGVPEYRGTFSTEPHPIDLAVDSRNRFFAVVHRDDHILAVYTMPDAMGNLTVKKADTCQSPRVVLFNAAGDRVFVLCDVPGLVDDFTIDDDGKPVWQAHAATGSTASRAMSLANNEDILLVVNGRERSTNVSETVRGFRIERSGLSAIDPAPRINGTLTAVAATDPGNSQAPPSPTAPATPPATSSDPAATAPPATSSPTQGFAETGGGGSGGGCNMVPVREGAPVPWLAMLGNLGLPCMALALMRIWHWGRGQG